MTKIILPFRVKRPILACGADLKAAFALAKGKEAYLVDGFGDLADLDNYTRYERAIKSWIRKLGIKPEIIACDLHPGYFSSRFAEDFLRKTKDERRKTITIQHHEAHVAAVIADNSIKGDVIGVTFDGTGFGQDGNIWGGEFFVGNAAGFRRVAHLEYVPMPGGEAVISQPWRMAASYLYNAFGKKFLKLNIDFVKRLDKKKWRILEKMVDKKINSPLTSSAGRLFDAVASLVLLKKVAAFEAELPIRLEEAADPSRRDHYGFDVKRGDLYFIVRTEKLLKGVVRDLLKKKDSSIISGKFHSTMAHIISDVSIKIRKASKIKKVVLTGGVFQNRYLTEKAFDMLQQNGFKVYVHSSVPTNDAGIPIGQIAIANARVRNMEHRLSV